MKQYKCHKIVKAFKILEILWDETNHAMMIQGDGEHDEISSMFFKSQEWCDAHKAKAGGYFVEYEDGYHSFSPAEVFESGYTLNEDRPEIMRHFAYSHLPSDLQKISQPFCSLANQMLSLPYCEERTAGLRKLLEAKDCAVRAALS